MVGKDKNRRVVRRVAPHPFHLSSGHAPRKGPNMLRPRIQAPMLLNPRTANSSSTPVVPSPSPYNLPNVRVATNGSRILCCAIRLPELLRRVTIHDNPARVGYGSCQFHRLFSLKIRIPFPIATGLTKDVRPMEHRRECETRVVMIFVGSPERERLATTDLPTPGKRTRRRRPH